MKHCLMVIALIVAGDLMANPATMTQAIGGLLILLAGALGGWLDGVNAANRKWFE